MQSLTPTSILPQHRILRENRPVRVGQSDDTGCDEHSTAEPTVRLIPDSSNPRAIEVVCLCGHRLEIELVYPVRN